MRTVQPAVLSATDDKHGQPNIRDGGRNSRIADNRNIRMGGGRSRNSRIGGGRSRNSRMAGSRSEARYGY